MSIPDDRDDKLPAPALRPKGAPAVWTRRKTAIALCSAATMAALGRPQPVRAQLNLSEKDAAAGLRAALERGAGIAVDLLGKPDGFWGNDRVRIPLPEWLQRGERMLKMLGRGNDVEQLKVGINRAAEQAVPEARSLLVSAVRGMSVQDARQVLTGGDDTATRYFADKTRTRLTARFTPIVSKVTDRIGLARQYNGLAAEGEKLGMVKPEDARVERHVTARALDGLFLMIGEEEMKIRRDPVSAGSDLLKRVFGALR